MSTRRKLLQILSVVIILSMMFSGLHLPTVSAQGGDGIKRQVNAQTGKVSFISPESGRTLSATRALGISAFDRPADPGMALAKRFGREFGLEDPGRDLVELKTNHSDNGRMAVRYQQNYQGVPVLGGELIVNTNEKGDLYSINGEISPDISLSTQPTVDPEQARQTALQSAAKWYEKAPEDFLASEPELWVYDESLLRPSTLPAELVWRMEVTAVDSGLPVRELVLVNAHRGTVSLYFNQVDTTWGGMTAEETPSGLNTPQETLKSNSDSKTSNSPFRSAAAQTGTSLYVATSGSSSSSCTISSPCNTIQRAINLAASGDTINVAHGTYYYPGSGVNSTPNVVIISGAKNLWLAGGWQNNFSTQTGVSIIDGQNTNNGILVTSTGEVVVQRFVIQNSRSADSGGIYHTGGVLGLVESTVRNNTATNRGAGVFVYGNASLYVVNSTISNNTSSSSGGGIFIQSSGTVDVEYSTIAYNTSTSGTGGGVFRYTGTMSVHNSILANNNGSTSPNCNSLSASDYNIIGSITGCDFTAGANDQTNTDPRINSTLLGVRPVHYLLSDSPAIDAGDLASCSMNAHYVDERGIVRPQGIGCDIGAVEYGAGFRMISGSDQTAMVGLAFNSPFTVYLSDASETPVPGVSVTFTAPSSGASGTFAGGATSVAVTTDGNGYATSPVFTANTTVGSYYVSATATGYSGAAQFSLINSNGVFVSTSGSDSNTCLEAASPCLTINNAIGRAAVGETVKIVGGTYPVTGTIFLNKNITLLGGWNTDFTAQNGQSIINGQGTYRGVTVNSGVTAVFERISVQNGQDSTSAGIYNAGTFTLNNGNVSNNNGVGVYNAGGTLILNNVTLAQNAGGLLNDSGTTTLYNSTVSGNTASYGGGIRRVAGTVTLKNTIVAGNSASNGPDCNGWISTYAGYNLIGNTAGCSGYSFSDNLTNVDPQLGTFFATLGYYPLRAGSPAIDAGNPATPGSGGNACLAQDQRGVTRPVGTRCDMGAYEYTSPGGVASLFIISGDDQNATPGSALGHPFKVLALDNQGSPIPGLGVTFTAPVSGASGTFAGDDHEIIVTTDANGVATSPTFTANALTGDYTVFASAGGAEPVSFSLHNSIWYVATTGSDSNDCITPVTPCQTINGALGKITYGGTVLVADGTYTGFDEQVVTVNKNVSLLGGWDTAFTFQHGWSTIDGQRERRGVTVVGGVSVTIEQFVIQNGITSIGGGGIYNLGTLVLNHSLVRNNTYNSTFGGPRGGGGLSNTGTLTLNNSAVVGNTSLSHGGGIFSSEATLILNNTTVSNNTAWDSGGIYSGLTAVTLNNSTISGNKAGYYGGGIAHGSVTIQNTLVAGNFAANGRSDCFSVSVTSGGYNLIGTNNNCTFSAATGDQIGTDAAPIDPRLVLLPSTDVAIFPSPLMAGSPAIDAGNPATPGSGGNACLAMDQRGVGRPMGARCDIGAFEYKGVGTTPAYIVAYAGTPQYLLRGAAAPSALKILLLSDAGDAIPGRRVTFTAPASGASVAFASTPTNIISIVADGNGIASTGAFSANTTAGDYVVHVTVEGMTGSVDFQLANGSQVKTYTANNTSAQPGTLLCDQNMPGCTGGSNLHADSVQLHSMGTYVFFWNKHGRQGIDNNNMPIISTVDYCSLGECPYYNASWNGTQVVYGKGYGFALADDIVAHELTHGVTQYESDLFYYYQSGAINESFSDLWGEYYDQSNGLGTDTMGVKWKIGEDIANYGAMRSMSNPPEFGDPDRMTSANYHKTQDDSGGVHHNSGVNNKAVFLMVEGNIVPFNGITVSPLGWEKTAAIYYEANTNLLISGADYSDLYYVLQQACSNLIGQKGITSGDCDQVKNAIDAVEMNLQPDWDFNTDVPYCDLGDPVVTILSDDLESGRGNWTFTKTGTPTRWQYDSPYGPFAHSGNHFLYADDFPPATTDASARLVSVAIPNNAYLHFSHAYGFENGIYQGTLYNFDGGVLEYSINGGSSWTDAGSLIEHNGYKGTIDIENPLAGRSGFVGASHGYIDTRLNLASLAGKNVIFRWRMGLDSIGSVWGWWLDDVKIYRCPSDTIDPSAINNLQAVTGSSSGIVNLSWTAPGDDGPAGTATSYLVRYSTAEINSEPTWDAATPVTSGIPTPQVATSSQNMVVSGLVPGQTYYFAIRARDEELNLGALSNSPSAAAWMPTPVSPNKYDDRHAAWYYTGSWTEIDMTGPYLGTFTYSAVTGNFAMFTFTGNRVTLYYMQNTNRGAANIYIDDFTTPVKILNMNGPLVWQQSWTSDILPTNGVHTVKVVHASGTYVDVDAVVVAVADTVAPSAINPLSAATGTANGTVDLSWAAPGDDGLVGTATSYLVRYSTSAISDESAWNAATPVTSGIPAPQAATSSQSMVVSGLVPGQTYYFAIRARDEELNMGALSNSPSAAAKSPEPLPPDKYDDRNTALIYTGSWIQASTTGPYLGTFTYSATVGNSAMFTFTGNRVTLYYLQNTNRGVANIYIDNFTTPVKVLNQNGSTLWQQSWTSDILPTNGVHTVKVVHASGTYVDVDAVVVAVADTVAPSVINPLTAATGTANGTVDLSWAAPGDDGLVGTATSYLVRYSTSAISDESAWNAATPVTSGIPAPQAATSSQSMVVSGLVPGQTYYFAIRARDEELNMGALSNSPSAAAKSPEPLPPDKYDDRNTALIYTGNWTRLDTTGPYLGTFTYSATAGNSVTFTFEGNKFTLYYLQNTNRGVANIYIDNFTTPAKVLNMNGALTWQKAWTSDILPTNGVHTVKVVHASGTYVDVDAIQTYVPLDPTPPAGIGDLTAATGTTGGSVNLSWTAPGDDGLVGTATSYVVRYSTSAINSDATWNAATPVTTGIPTPQAAGNSESMVVSGLTPGFVYHFAVRALDEESNQGALSNSALASAKVPDPALAGLYDDRQGNWSYRGSWTQGSTTGPHLSTFTYSATVGNMASFAFEGNKFTLYYLQHTNRGTAHVYIDSVEAPTATINMNGPMVWQKAWTSPTLLDGWHLVTVEHASGTYMDVDAIQIYDPLLPGKHDDPDTTLTYVGNWTPSTATGPYLDTFTYSSTVNDAAVFAFEGSRFALSYLQFTNRGTMKIYIDNFDTPVTTLNMNGSMVWQQTWTSAPLTPGVHIVKLVHASGTYVDVDAITVIGE